MNLFVRVADGYLRKKSVKHVTIVEVKSHDKPTGWVVNADYVRVARADTREEAEDLAARFIDDLERDLV